MPPKKAKKKAVNGYKMPEPLPPGEILTDISKKQWRLGTSIGVGGFGEIYSAQEASTKSTSKYPFVIKVEPHGNGPLFVEMHFYMKNAKEADIEAFRKKHKLKTFGMPCYIGSGSHELGANKFRFIVMEKFGVDVDKLRHDNNGVLPTTTVFQLAWQMVYVLEYIHEHDYVHADIKGANILMGITAESRNQAYLVDFGLATKFSTDKEFKPNPKKAHDGTIEYLSRDAHQGVPTRRGDLEILAYNMIHWLTNCLPWESKLDDPKLVQQIKEESMGDIPKFLKNCFNKNQIPGALEKFIKYVNNLKFNEEPDYGKIRNLFKAEITANGGTVSGPLEFHTARKRRSLTDRDTPEKKTKEDEEEKPKKQSKKDKVPRSNARKREVQEHHEEDEEVSKKDKVPRSNARKKEVQEHHEEEEEVMTPAMKEILAKKANKALKKNKQNGESSHTNNEDFEGYNDEMKEIKMKKINNEKKANSKKKSENSSTNGDEDYRGQRSRRNRPVVNYSEN